MACSKFEYVKQYESQEKLLPSTYIVIRLDGKGFTKFTDKHKFEKPNDIRGINLMNRAAKTVMERFPEIWLAYGESDEFSFVLRKGSTLYNRRSDKIATTLVSCFTASYALSFPEFFPSHLLTDLPIFDARCICYPDNQTIRDHFSWRQADCHINNMYNTCFWALVDKAGMLAEEAHKFLKGTDSGAKNELLFSKFGINYAKIDPVWRKGSLLLRVPKAEAPNEALEIVEENKSKIVGTEEEKVDTKNSAENVKEDAKEATQETIEISKKSNNQKRKELKKGQKDSNEAPKEVTKKTEVVILHEDLIGDDFWKKYEESLLL